MTRAPLPVAVFCALASLAVGCAGLAGCAWLGGGEPVPEEPEDGLSVVDARGPFDPREAVDDEEAPGEDDRPGEPTGEPASERSDEREGGDLAGEHSEEEVATPERARAREEAQEVAAERAEEAPVDDDEAKAAAATNPPPEDPGRAEPPVTSALDSALEFGVIVALAAAISLALHPLHRHPRLALGLALGATLLVAAGVAVLA